MPSSSSSPSSPPSSASGGRIVLIVGGGVGAYKSLELIRLLSRHGIAVTPILTAAAQRFITPLSAAALAGETPRREMFDAEAAMDHIDLSRNADLIVVAPASADLIGRMAAGLADDLATTLLLAADKPTLIAPAMNVRMWEHSAVRDNVSRLAARGVRILGPDIGVMACGESGAGRMVEPDVIAAAILSLTPSPATAIGKATKSGALAGKRALVTAGATREPLDPVRYLSNRSSGRQGYAVAAALARRGAEVTLISGVAAAPPPPVPMRRLDVETGRDMMKACLAALPVDIAVCVAAVSDWRPESPSDRKRDKNDMSDPTPESPSSSSSAKTPKTPTATLKLIANPDILHALASKKTQRPALTIGFAAETHDIAARGAAKRKRKKADWMLCNDVSAAGGAMGGEDNQVHVIDDKGEDAWPRMTKSELAERLVDRIVAHFAETDAEA